MQTQLWDHWGDPEVGEESWLSVQDLKAPYSRS